MHTSRPGNTAASRTVALSSPQLPAQQQCFLARIPHQGRGQL